MPFTLGKALMCSKTTGTLVYLQHGRSGVILSQNKPEEIGSIVARLISDPQLRLAPWDWGLPSPRSEFRSSHFFG